jgi:hypothetical protein
VRAPSTVFQRRNVELRGRAEDALFALELVTAVV